jgi:hypothetical protein
MVSQKSNYLFEMLGGVSNMWHKHEPSFYAEKQQNSVFQYCSTFFCGNKTFLHHLNKNQWII